MRLLTGVDLFVPHEAVMWGETAFASLAGVSSFVSREFPRVAEASTAVFLKRNSP